MRPMIVNTRFGTAGMQRVRGRRPCGAAPADRRPLPPWAGRRASPRVYFDGVMQSVND